MGFSVDHMCRRWVELTLDRCHAAHINAHTHRKTEIGAYTQMDTEFYGNHHLNRVPELSNMSLCFQSNMIKLVKGFLRKLYKVAIPF